ncbi:MAG: TAXI family TRAP transporter solute-binding subunit [Burkholderiaceae bacterium]
MTSTSRAVRSTIALGLCLLQALASAAASTSFKIVTASERGTYIQIGRDLAFWVAPAAGVDLQVLPSAGSAENVRRLRHEPGVRLALVQSDVYQAFLDQDAGGNAEAGSLIRPLRVVMPLYDEEIYFIVRADAPLEFVHDIRDARINVGPLLSGTAMSATTLYRQMFGRVLPESQAGYLSNEEALVKLTGDRSVDVVVVVAGQPAKLLLDMTPQARTLVKLLKFDRSSPAGQAALQTYFPAIVRAASYPNLLTDDVPSLAVRAFLVTYDYGRADTVATLRRFARSLCKNFPQLRESGHAKWREVDLALPDLGQGWRYSEPMARELRHCIASAPRGALPAPPPRAVCSQQDRVLGLCR